jgi:hypothetical protein
MELKFVGFLPHIPNIYVTEYLFIKSNEDYLFKNNMYICILILL